MSVDFGAAVAAIERMKREGVVSDYAAGGAMALHQESALAARPSVDLLERLRRDTLRLHAAARALSPAEKVRRVIELQRIVLPHLARRRPLRPHEFVWEEREEPDVAD